MSNVPILSWLSRQLKRRYFFDLISQSEGVLEIGCGDGWVGRCLRQRGVRNVISIDTAAPATIVGDIRQWRDHGLIAHSFDVIIAFEVLEHVDCLSDCFSLLKPGGRLMVTTPCPAADRFLELLELLRLNQRRTSVHDHLLYVDDIDGFRIVRMWRPLKLSQWCVLERR